jgi:hypothetical protein
MYSCKDYSNDIVSEHYNSKELNGAILPEIIYKTDSKIKIEKEELIQILEEENKIRLSSFIRDLFDANSMENYIELDTMCIKLALIKKGYHPDTDDSLKAYHLSTGKHINDTEVKEKVVWLKYDKARLGNLKVGDDIVTDNIYLYNQKFEKIPLTDLLSKDLPNVIVTGSLS